MRFKQEDSLSNVYNFNFEWSFKLADAFPLKAALDKHKDAEGKYFYETGYKEASWEKVGVPHTFNGEDMFVNRIEDAGTGQKRTFSFYRKWFDMPSEHDGKKVLIEFEGMRQTCYLYVNGQLAGYYETGVAPFAFDITAYINYNGSNLIAVATDNTSTRNIDYCAAETPNKKGAEPGTYLARQAKDAELPGNEGVGFFWNCNDFNPAIGGLSKNIKLHIKPKIYLTLPIYSNLQTKGIYIYGTNFDIKNKTTQIHIEAEIRNETGTDETAELESVLVDHAGNVAGVIRSVKTNIKKADLPNVPPLSITPEDAYIEEEGRFVPENDESKVKPTKTESLMVTVINSEETINNLNFWSVNDPYLYEVYTNLIVGGKIVDTVKTVTGFRKVDYDNEKGMLINDEQVWLTGYAQRSANEWAAIGAAVDWLKDVDAKLVRESNANHIRWMHVAACPADIRSCDRYGIICTQPAGDKERENFGRQWDQRVELMRDIIIYFRNNPSIIYWETGNNAVNKEHMREMTLLKRELDPLGGRYMGCRTLSTDDVLNEAEYVGTMLNRHAGRFQSINMPVTETEYSREESPRRVWDDFSPPDFDYDNVWVGKGGRKQIGRDVHDLTAEEFALVTARGYGEFFHDRMGGASKKNLYSAAAALCWTDSAQHGRQAASENARMSGRVDPVRIKKQNFYMYKVMQSSEPMIKIIGHWNYPEENGVNYRYPIKQFNGEFWEKTGEYGFRNPKNKTVYVCGSYSVVKVELFINDKLAGVCDKPIHTFIFPFEGIDITQQGSISAKGYDQNGCLTTEDKIETVSEPHNIKIIPHTGGKGFLADGTDIAYFDIEVVDIHGRVCPLCYDRIDFELVGEAVFLGGYNSGRFNGYGKNDSVIRQSHVYAECGINRVFIRSTNHAGAAELKAVMQGLPAAVVRIESISADINALSKDTPQMLEESMLKNIPLNDFGFETIEAADLAKYIPDNKTYCKVLINGSEVDTQGRRPVYEDNGVWGPVLPVLNRIRDGKPGLLSFEYDQEKQSLTLETNGHKITATAGHTHLIVDGEENLMNGQPVIKNDVFWMELSAVISYINGVKAYYDSRVGVYRIEL